MAKIQGLQTVLKTLQGLAAKAKLNEEAEVHVGYSVAYALYVHENIQMKWKGLPRKKPAKGVYWGPKGQAKFLEEPARRMKKELGEIITTAFKKGKTMSQALLLAGLRLQRESQKLVPVDTGALKNSAFTTVK